MNVDKNLENTTRSTMTDITTEELKVKLDNNEEFVFIDVREPYENLILELS